MTSPRVSFLVIFFGVLLGNILWCPSWVIFLRVLLEALGGLKLDHTGSPSQQVEQTLPHHQTHAAKPFRNA